jgi:hypothetical protein
MEWDHSNSRKRGNNSTGASAFPRDRTGVIFYSIFREKVEDYKNKWSAFAREAGHPFQCQKSGRPVYFVRTCSVRMCQWSQMRCRNKEHNGNAVEGLQAFRTIAHDGGFIDLEESENGTVLWLRRQSPDAPTNTHQRICMDSVTNSVTVYWTTSLGKVESKTFRTATDLREWLASQAVR